MAPATQTQELVFVILGTLVVNARSTSMNALQILARTPDDASTEKTGTNVTVGLATQVSDVNKTLTTAYIGHVKMVELAKMERITTGAVAFQITQDAIVKG